MSTPSAIGPLNLTLLPVDVEVGWERGPLERRAREIHAAQDLPDWKLPETVRSLERILDAAIAEGKSPSSALAYLDAKTPSFF
ncbi:hypothetical protein IQ289_25555 [Burkholderia sp. R-70006]|uniref:hypothetical protein n=1 Tax=Paraburkholderia domus TaxID=2793075 RepID=UPI0019124E5F|nr:hypothetical protein [Paraburkholderia domus]MBK5051751.1 hypothetical protein [Burkholderia sp. R-70006]